ncbi:MAG: hypothetical protein Q7U66_14070 [Methylobacter sp.]|nr:hypothetical protein [Methylobacter sp.]
MVDRTSTEIAPWTLMKPMTKTLPVSRY